MSKRILAIVIVPTLFALIALGLVAPPAGAALPNPLITSPAAGAAFCSKPGPDFSVVGTADPTHPANLVVNGTPDSTVTPAADGSFTFPVDRPEGTYTFHVDQSDGTTTSTSPDVTSSVFGTADVLSPFQRPLWAIISPTNQDGYKDTLTLALPVLKNGIVQFQIFKGTTLIASSPAVATNAGTSPYWVWNGKTSSGAYAPSTDYAARATWTATGDTACTFSRETTVVVDDIAPGVAGYSNPDRFYPRTDDAFTHYKDAIPLSWGTPTENTYVQVEIYNHNAATPLGTLAAGWKTTAGSITWNGRHTNGSLFPAGIYDARLRLTDPSGNVHRATRTSFTLDLQHLVARTAMVQVNGNSPTNVIRSGCGDVDQPLSSWPEGLWLYAPDCYTDNVLIDAVSVDYQFTVPAAAYYNQLTLGAGGYSMDGDPLFGFIDNYQTGASDIVGSIATSSPAALNFGTVGSVNPRYINSSRHVGVSLFLFSPCDCKSVDYDVRKANLTVSYGVLVP